MQKWVTEIYVALRNRSGEATLASGGVQLPCQIRTPSCRVVTQGECLQNMSRQTGTFTQGTDTEEQCSQHRSVDREDPEIIEARRALSLTHTADVNDAGSS